MFKKVIKYNVQYGIVNLLEIEYLFHCRVIWATKIFIRFLAWRNQSSFIQLIVDGTDNFVPGGVIVVTQIYLLIIQNAAQKLNCGTEIAILLYPMIKNHNFYSMYCGYWI